MMSFVRAHRLALAPALILSLAGLPAGAVFAFQDAAGGERAPGDGVTELLDAIERAEGKLRSLTAMVLYDKEFALAGDLQRRTGELFFNNTEGGRSFAIRFDKLRLGDVVHDDVQEFVFDGEWLVERQPGKKLFTKRQVVPPGQEFDPLKIGEGPLPIPIGQKRADIERTFDVSSPGVTDSLTEGTDAFRIASAPNSKVRQLKLVPKPGTRESDDFEEIRVWYKDHEGGVLPTMARTVNHQGDIALVVLIAHKVNDEAQIPDGIFSTEAPERGWDVQILPFREDADASPTGMTSPVFAYDPPKPGDRRLAKVKVETPFGDPVEGVPVVMAIEGTPSPELPDVVSRQLDAEYLTDDERAEIRRKHGFWTAEDIAEPDHRAETAIARHDWLDPVFDDTEVRPDLRAEGLIRRGEPGLAIELLAGRSDLRSIRLRAEALAVLGQYEQADAALAPLVERLQRVRIENADDMCEAVRALMLRAKIRGQERADGTDFDTLMALLKQAREKLDPMSWRVRLVEAELLFDKNNRTEARDTAIEALGLNPAAAGPLVVLGEIAVGSLSFTEAQQYANRMRASVSCDVPWWVEAPEDVEQIVSLPSTALRAKARLRQDDPDGALRLIERALEDAPRSRDQIGRAHV